MSLRLGRSSRCPKLSDHPPIVERMIPSSPVDPVHDHADAVLPLPLVSADISPGRLALDIEHAVRHVADLEFRELLDAALDCGQLIAWVRVRQLELLTALLFPSYDGPVRPPPSRPVPRRPGPARPARRARRPRRARRGRRR
jgi:hypothetical protein